MFFPPTCSRKTTNSIRLLPCYYIRPFVFFNDQVSAGIVKFYYFHGEVRKSSSPFRSIVKKEEGKRERGREREGREKSGFWGWIPDNPRFLRAEREKEGRKEE